MNRERAAQLAEKMAIDLDMKVCVLVNLFLAKHLLKWAKASINIGARFLGPIPE